MAKIRTFARIKPAEDLYDDFDTTRNRLYLRIPDSYSRDSTLYNRSRAPIVNHEFKYSQIFSEKSSQEEVYDVAAKSIIDGFLEGYNGTIFAYGQTASGKTYTMQGNLTDSDHKGLAPRSLTRIFSAVNARKEAGENISMHCSFLEIYQEVGYDLLKPASKGVSSGSKVTVVDGPQGAAVVKNLSILSVSSEEAAQAFLAQGELNRKVAETAMNNRSSRSHAVFTVYLSSRKGDLLVRSKMHFVDLAGSERVCKTGVKGLQLSEAKYINLSLHYLEGVIIALHQDATTSSRLNTHTAPSGVSKSWSATAMSKRPYSAADSSGRPRHIPYRNSLLTMMLKDSLGGNCLTTMIATVSLELINLSETISTCRFAQRVSCIANVARKNEEIDDKSMIKKLRTRVAELEAENNMLKHGGPVNTPIDEEEKPLLTAQDKQLCQHVVKDFLNGKLVDPIVAGVTDPYKFRECMSIFKKLIKEHSDKSIRLAEKLKQQPSHIQEAFFTGGRYHEAPLAKPSKRQEINFRDDANALTRTAYANWNARQRRAKGTSFKPTILKTPNTDESKHQHGPTEAWQVQLNDDSRTSSKPVQDGRPKPQSAGVAMRRVSTPFDRKRNQEVAQLNKKVEANLAQQLEQANHLKAFKKTIVQQELEIAIQSLKRKLEVTQHQLADQHAYTKRLRQQTTDQDLLEQENLVKGQLQKRVDKIQREINNAEERLADIQNRTENTSDNHPPQYRSVKDKFATMVKKDGTLDAVKVRTTLQQQEKLQTQLQKKIDRQRALAIDKHLEVQERSTRQKLEDFKRKLVESRQGQRSNEQSVSSQSVPATPIKDTRESAHTPKRELTQPRTEVKKNQISDSRVLQETFQARIEEETSNRERSINEILIKYRAGNRNDGETARVSKRTEKVNHILAKYTESKVTGQVGEKTVPSSSVAINTPNLVQEKAMPTISEGEVPQASDGFRRAQTSVAHTRVRVANSAMEYKAPVIKKVGISENMRQDYQKRPQTTPEAHQLKQFSSATKVDDRAKNLSNFQETLKTMLHTRQGHHKKRTDAWSGNGAPPKHNDGKKDVTKTKLQHYLSKQSKKKVQESTTQHFEAKPKSQAHSTKSNYASKNKYHLATKSNTHTPLRNDKEFSHRMSHYQMNKGDVDHNRTTNHSKEPKETEQVESISESEVDKSSSTAIIPKEYTNLRKLTRRNEHTMQVRKIQNAAIIIQRMWRRHRYQLT